MPIVFTQKTSKVKQLADAISAAISARSYGKGESLPSINQLSQKYGVSRDTVFKAFAELKRRGVVDSTPTKGYFVCEAVIRVLLLLDTYSPFKYQLHDTIAARLPLNYKVDLHFHQYNEQRFEKIITESAGRYNYYLIMNFENDRYCDILDTLDPNKVMLLDFGKFEKDKFSYACQDFDEAFYNCLVEGEARIRKYRKMVLVFPEHSEHPRSCIPYFMRFCAERGLQPDLVTGLDDTAPEAGTAYIIIRHPDLIGFIKSVREKGLKTGRDVGVIVMNDAPVFGIIEDGITSISADFARMGNLAAEFVLTREKIQEFVPTRLIARGSL